MDGPRPKKEGVDANPPPKLETTLIQHATVKPESLQKQGQSPSLKVYGDKIPNSFGHAFVLIRQKRDEDWKVTFSLWKCSKCDLLRRKASLLICASPLQNGSRHTVYGWRDKWGGCCWQNPRHVSECDGRKR